MATQQEVIKTFMQTLNDTTLKGGKALDAAIKASSKFKNFEAVKKQFLKDQEESNWHTFLLEKCGIVLDNADTGAISGSDAGGKKTKTATDILPSTGDAKYPEGSSFTVDGLTIYGIPSKNRLTADQQYVIQGLYSWWIRDSLALIKESYGFSYTDADTTNSRLKMKFVDEPDSGTFAYVSFDSDDDKTYESRVLCVNMGQFKNMDTSNRHGSTDSAALDRVLVHELVHGLMASNVKYFYDLPDFLKEGGSAELIHGLDDENYDEVVAYAQDPEIFKKILTTSGFGDEDPPYEIYTGGYIFMRYFAKQAATNNNFAYDSYRKTISIGSKGGFDTNYWNDVTMKGGNGKDTITNSGEHVSITAGKGNDVVKTYADSVTVNAGDGDDFVLNYWGDKVSIVGGKGKDTLDNQGDSSKVTGGAGNDSISNTGDKVTISGDADKDYIRNEGAQVSVSGGAGNDTIFNDVSIAMDEELDEGYIATNGATISAEDGKDYLASLTGGSNSSLWGGKGNDVITNQAIEVKIFGDAGNDSITNYGFNATIEGGAGNDYILNDSISFEIDDGSVTITGYEANLDGGDGDDFFKNTVDEVKIYGQEGADTISNSGEEASIYGGAGIDVVDNKGDSVYISFGDGNDVLENSADLLLALGGAGEDEFTNFGDDATLSGGADDDYIDNYGDNSSLSGDKGNDYIYSCGENSILLGGDGNDTLFNEGVKASLVGGAGKDEIYNEGDHITISGGAGNDNITNYDGRHITYNFGKSDGKDTIVGFNANDTIKITSGTYKASKSGKNVIVTVGSAKLTLKDAVGKKINFVDSKDKKTTKTYKKVANVSSAKIKSTVETHWFDETNFAASNDLSSLVKDKNISASCLVAELDSTLTKLGMKNNLVSYSGSSKK